MKRRKPKLKWVKNAVSKRRFWLGPELRWDGMVHKMSLWWATPSPLLFPLSTLLPFSFPSFFTYFPSRAFFSSVPLLGIQGTKDGGFGWPTFLDSRRDTCTNVRIRAERDETARKHSCSGKWRENSCCDCLSARPQRSGAFTLLPPLRLALLSKMLYSKAVLTCSRRSS